MSAWVPLWVHKWSLAGGWMDVNTSICFSIFLFFLDTVHQSIEIIYLLKFATRTALLAIGESTTKLHLRLCRFHFPSCRCFTSFPLPPPLPLPPPASEEAHSGPRGLASALTTVPSRVQMRRSEIPGRRRAHQQNSYSPTITRKKTYLRKPLLQKNTSNLIGYEN